MPVIPAKENAEILALFTSGRVEEGFARLARFADLKQNDLPSLDKKAVAALGSSADAVRAFASGLFSGSASVRRMARKYAGKLGDAGAPAIALALAEAVRPLRKIGSPEEALLGSFGGFASPLGKTFDEVKPSTAIPQNGYSEAWRLAKEALETATAALGSSRQLLFSENVPTLADAMRALRPIVASAEGGGLGVVGEGPKPRALALGEQEPKKLGKLAEALLE